MKTFLLKDDDPVAVGQGRRPKFIDDILSSPGKRLQIIGLAGDCSSYCSTGEYPAKPAASKLSVSDWKGVAGTTGLEPATSDVTGLRSGLLKSWIYLCSQ